jgi:hypothetical protein
MIKMNDFKIIALYLLIIVETYVDLTSISRF